MLHKKWILNVLSFFICMCVGVSAFSSELVAQRDTVSPVYPAGVMVNVSEIYNPAKLRGIKFDPLYPFNVDFIIDTGDEKDVSVEERQRMVRYFLGALTIKDGDLWVNLSPYEHDRIIDDTTAATEIGRTLLEQDYLLKQLSASLTMPGTPAGDAYWEEIAGLRSYGITNPKDKDTITQSRNHLITNSALSRIWISPENVSVYDQNDAIFVVGAGFRVESELLKVESELLKSVAREVNAGRNFAPLRQMVYSIILAQCFKRKFAESLYSFYFDSKKTAGLDINDPDLKEKVFAKYVESFEKGAYDITRKERNAAGHLQKRKYFSGGFEQIPYADIEHTGSSAVTGLFAEKFLLQSSALILIENDNAAAASSALPGHGETIAMKRLNSVIKLASDYESAADSIKELNAAAYRMKLTAHLQLTDSAQKLALIALIGYEHGVLSPDDIKSQLFYSHKGDPDFHKMLAEFDSISGPERKFFSRFLTEAFIFSENYPLELLDNRDAYNVASIKDLNYIVIEQLLAAGEERLNGPLRYADLKTDINNESPPQVSASAVNELSDNVQEFLVKAAAFENRTAELVNSEYVLKKERKELFLTAGGALLAAAVVFLFLTFENARFVTYVLALIASVYGFHGSSREITLYKNRKHVFALRQQFKKEVAEALKNEKSEFGRQFINYTAQRLSADEAGRISEKDVLKSFPEGSMGPVYQQLYNNHPRAVTDLWSAIGVTLKESQSAGVSSSLHKFDFHGMRNILDVYFDDRVDTNKYLSRMMMQSPEDHGLRAFIAALQFYSRTNGGFNEEEIKYSLLTNIESEDMELFVRSYYSGDAVEKIKSVFQEYLTKAAYLKNTENNRKPWENPALIPDPVLSSSAATENGGIGLMDLLDGIYIAEAGKNIGMSSASADGVSGVVFEFTDEGRFIELGRILDIVPYL